MMVNVSLFSLVFPMAAAATLMAGYSYMEEREKRQENTLMKALEEMNMALIVETSRWEERHLLQEKRIKDILRLEKRLEDVEAEQRRVRRERNQLKRDESLQLLEPTRGNPVSSLTFVAADPKPEKKRTDQFTTNICKPTTPDPNVALRNLSLTENNRRATRATADVRPEKKRTECLVADVKPECYTVRRNLSLTENDRKAARPPADVKPEKKRTEFLAADVKPEKKRTDQFSTNICKLTLDPNTAHRNLALTENNRKATRVTEIQLYPHHADRFDYWEQVLCREGLTGRCYWEVDWSGRVSIAMAYKSINRRGVGGDCGFGYNNKSWSLECYKWRHYKRCSVRHNRRTTELQVDPSGANRVGVYLDSEAGNLSFYSISSDTWTHLHTFQATFTEPLYPGFMFGSDSSVSLYQIESM